VSLIVYLILLMVEGLIVGAFARLALPGKDPMTLFETTGVGLAGSFVGGMLVYAISGGTATGGFLVSLVFATLIVYFVRRHRGGGLTRPSGPDRDGSALR
jgi:uncharacterized membrane protein YeaQ/YmgE (transglycosylase-associated protein family)